MKIKEYKFGRINVEGNEFSNDLIIFPDTVKPNWWRKEGHNLHIEDLKEEGVLERKPEILVIGKGASERMRVSEHVKDALKQKGIKKVITLNTHKACKKFNKLMEAGKEAVAALHLTC